MIGSLRRRDKIRNNWKFDCTCERCSDRTEFGSFVNAAKCQKCTKGFLLPDQALDYDSLWSCDKCPEKVNSCTMMAIVKVLEGEAETFKEYQIEAVENQIQKWIKVLHPSHYLILTFKKRLLDLLSLHKAPEDEAQWAIGKPMKKYYILRKEMTADYG
jgi:hypothetical protein